MYLHHIKPNPRSPQARRDLANPYAMHATLSRVFSPPDHLCPPGTFLWRLERSPNPCDQPSLLLQSETSANWTHLTTQQWSLQSSRVIDLRQQIQLEHLQSGQSFRFRLRANPTYQLGSKRQGLTTREGQERWIIGKAQRYGFTLPSIHDYTSDQPRLDIQISEEGMLQARQHTGNIIKIFSVQFDGYLTITNPELFTHAIKHGIGHGKVLGLGLLSIFPTSIPMALS